MSSRARCLGYDVSFATAPTSVVQKAGRSSGLRLDTKVFGPREHSTTSSSTQLAPALTRSVLTLGHEVSVLPRTTSASMSVHGPWQITATGLPCVEEALRECHRRRVGPQKVGIGDTAGQHEGRIVGR